MARLLTYGLPGRVFYGWWIVAVLFLAEFIAAGAGTFTFGLYLKPMSEELLWSRSQVVAALTLRSVVIFATAPAVGILLDRYGPRLLVSAGAATGGVALVSLFWMHSLWHWYLAYGLGGALEVELTGAMVAHTTMAKWFVRRRGRAIAITSFGISLGGMAMTPVTQAIISTLGWRYAWLIFGLLLWALPLPVAALVLRRAPEDLGLHPDGETPVAPAAERADRQARASQAEEVSWTVSEAIRTRTLWLMVAAFSLSGLALSPILTHQAAYITDRGFSNAVAATVVTAFAGLSAVAQLVWGLLGERFSIRLLVTLSFSIAAVGVVFLIFASNIAMLALYVAVYGSTRAVAALSGLAYANYWGRAFLGSIRGVAQPLNTLASAAGPLLAAVIFDVRGSYIMAFSASLVLFLMAALLMALAPPPKKRPGPEPAPSA